MKWMGKQILTYCALLGGSGDPCEEGLGKGEEGISVLEGSRRTDRRARSRSAAGHGAERIGGRGRAAGHAIGGGKERIDGRGRAAGHGADRQPGTELRRGVGGWGIGGWGRGGKFFEPG